MNEGWGEEVGNRDTTSFHQPAIPTEISYTRPVDGKVGGLEYGTQGGAWDMTCCSLADTRNVTLLRILVSRNRGWEQGGLVIIPACVLAQQLRCLLASAIVRTHTPR